MALPGFATVSELMNNSLLNSLPSKESLKTIKKDLKSVENVSSFDSNHELYVKALIEAIGKHKDNLTEEAKECMVKVGETVFNQFYQPKMRIKQALFFPSEENETILINWLKKATKTLEVCVFCITNNKLADALKAAKDAGARVRVISDDEQAKELGSDIQDLAELGIEVELDQDRVARMHNKFAIIDGKILINGSFNWTVQAVKKNQENVHIIDDENIIELYSKEFEKLWKQFEGGRVVKTGKLPKRFEEKPPKEPKKPKETKETKETKKPKESKKPAKKQDKKEEK